jgi:hypothetical protein
VGWYESSRVVTIREKIDLLQEQSGVGRESSMVAIIRKNDIRNFLIASAKRERSLRVKLLKKTRFSKFSRFFKSFHAFYVCFSGVTKVGGAGVKLAHTLCV